MTTLTLMTLINTAHAQNSIPLLQPQGWHAFLLAPDRWLIRHHRRSGRPARFCLGGGLSAKDTALVPTRLYRFRPNAGWFTAPPPDSFTLLAGRGAEGSERLAPEVWGLGRRWRSER